MKALVCREFGPPESLTVAEVPDPVPGDHDVVIDVHAAGANFPDTLIIQNKYQLKPPLPLTPGGECAGVIAQVGAKVAHLRPGMRVIALTGHGAFAEKVVCNARMMLPMPDDLDMVTASAFVMTYATSYHALVDRAAIKSGETLLVLGASGGVGLAAVEIGKALGARVMAAASSPDKLAVCRDHGADLVIDYAAEDLRGRIKELTHGKGVDVIYDPVGGPYTEAALRGCAWRGRLLVVGFAAGDIPRLPANLILLKGCAALGVFWGEFAKREPGRLLADLQVLFGWVREGRLRPRIAGVYPLARSAEALRALMDRKVSGKLVVAMPVAELAPSGMGAEG